MVANNIANNVKSSKDHSIDTKHSIQKHSIHIDDICVSYGSYDVLKGLTCAIQDQKINIIIGANGSGKSTLIKAINNQIKYTGNIYAYDVNIQSYHRREFAKIQSYLSQNSVLPEDITVADLISYGRAPYQSLFGIKNNADINIIDDTMNQMGIYELRNKKLSEISGGQRQKTWIAMVLVQDTPIVLLDEPSTYLDIGSQYLFMELIEYLVHEKSKTVVAIMHELNLVSKYGDHIIMISDEGHKIAEGQPLDVLTKENINKAFYFNPEIIYHNNKPIIL